MNQNYYVPKIFFIVILLVTISFIHHNETSFVFAETVTQLEQNIKNRNAEIRDLEKEAARIREELAKTGSAKASLNRDLAIINGEKKSLENNIAQTRTKINLLDSEIEKTEYQIKDYNDTIIKQSKFLGSLLRRVNQQDSFSILENFLSTQSLSSYFRIRDQYISLQKPILENTSQLRNNKITLSLGKQKLSKKQEILQVEKGKYDDQKSIIISQENKKRSVLIQTKNKESLFQQNLKKTLAMISALDKEIRDFESKLEFILNKDALPKRGSVVFDWPLDYVLITQRFGKTSASGRLYASGSHSGNDFRAAMGTPVYAVADGKVLGTGNTDEVCYRASFGKWVFIEHDMGLSTTYGHLSKISVSEGQRIKKGDLIAYSGNSGYSTAPHLHLTTYATKGVNGEQGVRITNRPSKACAGKTYRMPLAPTAAYLDPLDFLPKTSLDMFKHPDLAL